MFLMGLLVLLLMGLLMMTGLRMLLLMLFLLLLLPMLQLTDARLTRQYPIVIEATLTAVHTAFASANQRPASDSDDECPHYAAQSVRREALGHGLSLVSEW